MVNVVFHPLNSMAIRRSMGVENSKQARSAPMDRRSFLVGGGLWATGMATRPAEAQSPPIPGQTAAPLAPSEIEAAVVRRRKQCLAQFDPAYVENVIVPYFLITVYHGETPVLPMIGTELTK